MTDDLKVAHLESFVRGAGLRVVAHRKQVHAGLCLVPDFGPGPADAHLYVCKRRLARLARKTDGYWFVVGHEHMEAQTLPGLAFWLAAELWERSAKDGLDDAAWTTGNTITEGGGPPDTD